MRDSISQFNSPRFLLLSAAFALSAAAWYVVAPEPVAARRSGCDQVCAAGHCVFSSEPYFCHSANPPWTLCEYEPYDCRVE